MLHIFLNHLLYLSLKRSISLTVVSLCCLIYPSPSYSQSSNKITNSISSKANELIVGTTDSTQEGDIADMFERLQAGLTSNNDVKINMIVETSSSKLQKKIDNGTLDIVFSHGLGVVNVLAVDPTAVILQTVESNYASIPLVFAVKKTSSIKTLDDLSGRKLALKNMRQRRQFFAPTWLLLTNGMEWLNLETVRSPVNSDSNAVSIVFAGHEENLTEWLHRGLVDAVAYSLRDWEDEEKVPLTIRETFRSIYNDRVFLNGYAALISRKSLDMKPDIIKALAPIETGSSLIEQGFVPITVEHQEYLTEVMNIMKRSETGYLNRE